MDNIYIQVIELKKEQHEQYILVVMNGSNFLELVHCTKQVMVYNS